MYLNGKNIDYFQRLLNEEKNLEVKFTKTVSERALEASFVISQMIAKNMKVRTIARYISELSRDTEELTVETIGSSRFALQADEASDYSGKCHLLTFVWFINGYNIIDQFLFMKEMKTRMTGEDIFQVADTFFTIMECCGITVLVSVLTGSKYDRSIKEIRNMGESQKSIHHLNTLFPPQKGTHDKNYERRLTGNLERCCVCGKLHKRKTTEKSNFCCDL